MILRYKSYFVVLFLFSCSMVQAQEDLALDGPVKARILEIGVMLEWEDTINRDVPSYIIERSMDGLSFEAIGETEISKEYDTHRYLDVLARSNPIYYRLGIFKPDGVKMYSEIVRVDQTPPNDFMISHLSKVKTTDFFTVDIESFTAGELQYTVRNWNGMIEQSGSMVLTTGLNQLTIDVSESDPSIYRLHLKMSDEKEVLTFERIADDMNQTASDR